MPTNKLLRLPRTTKAIMISYLKFLRGGSLTLVILAGLSFFALLFMSDSLTIGGEMILVILVVPIIYYLILFGITQALLATKKPSIILTIIVTALFFAPLLVIFNIEGAFNFIFPTIDMK